MTLNPVKAEWDQHTGIQQREVGGLALQQVLREEGLRWQACLLLNRMSARCPEV